VCIQVLDLEDEAVHTQSGNIHNHVITSGAFPETTLASDVSTRRRGVGRWALDLLGAASGDLCGKHRRSEECDDDRHAHRVLATLERNPQILTQLLSTVDTVVGTAGRVGETLVQPGGALPRAVGVLGEAVGEVTRVDGLLFQLVDGAGRTVHRTVDQTGGLRERTLDPGGAVVSERNLGDLLDQAGLRLLQETRDETGRVVRRVQDAAGAVVDLTLEQGRVVAARVVREASPASR
jgi:hypothetical protein